MNSKYLLAFIFLLEISISGCSLLKDRIASYPYTFGNCNCDEYEVSNPSLNVQLIIKAGFQYSSEVLFLGVGIEVNNKSSDTLTFIVDSVKLSSTNFHYKLFDPRKTIVRPKSSENVLFEFVGKLDKKSKYYAIDKVALENEKVNLVFYINSGKHSEKIDNVTLIAGKDLD